MAAAAGVPEIVGAVFTGVAALAVIVNAGKAADAWPSLTLITTLANVPAADGVPCKRPVAAVNVAHAGRLVMLNVNGLPFASLAVG